MLIPESKHQTEIVAPRQKIEIPRMHLTYINASDKFCMNLQPCGPPHKFSCWALFALHFPVPYWNKTRSRHIAVARLPWGQAWRTRNRWKKLTNQDSVEDIELPLLQRLQMPGIAATPFKRRLLAKFSCFLWQSAFKKVSTSSAGLGGQLQALKHSHIWRKACQDTTHQNAEAGHHVRWPFLPRDWGSPSSCTCAATKWGTESMSSLFQTICEPYSSAN